MKISEVFLKGIIASLIKEEIRKVKGGYKVYPKKPQKGSKVKKALSKKPLTYQKALSQLRAVERSKSLNEASDAGYVIPNSDIISAINRAFQILDFENPVLKRFMYRIARVESGGNPSGTGDLTHHKKNPFQLDPPAVENVKENINLRKWRSFIDEKQGKNPAKLGNLLENQSYNEVISNNVLSALFATLYVLWSNKNWNPEDRTKIKFYSDLKSQADFWKKNYNTELGKGKVSDFISKNKSK